MKKRSNIILRLSKSQAFVGTQVLCDCLGIVCRKAYITASLLDGARRAGGLNWQIFFSGVGACLPAGLRKRERDGERDRLMNPECGSTEVRLEAAGAGVKVQVEGDI